MWHAAERAGVPVIAFVNGMDRERANFEAAVESLRGLGASPVPIALPLGAGPKLRGVIDLLARRAIVDGKEVEIPAEAAGAADEARARLVEAVAETDDTLLEHYLEAGELADEEVTRGLVAATHARRLVPVLAGAALSEVGAGLALRSAIRLLPPPRPRPATALAGGDVEALPSASAPFAAQVFKTVADRYAGTLSLLRVVSGTLRPDGSLSNATRGSKERVGKILLMRGAEHVDVPEAGPGDVVALAKLKDVHTGDALTQDKGGVALAKLPIPVGVLSYAVSAKAKADEDKLFTALGRLAHEDPTLQISRDPSTGEFLLTGMGELHIRVAVQRLRRLYEVDIELKTPKVPYRETITRKAENVEGKLKKQTGGKGMFGVCYLSVEPLPRGAGIEFVDEIVGGAIPRNLIPAVEKGVIESAAAGPLAGFPVVDVRVRCVDGKFHSVDSNEMAFKLAGSFGFKAAVEQARPTLLEPIMKAEITVPDDHLGDVMGDISSRRGRVQGTESRGHAQVVKAEVPMAEMLEYANALTSLTGGKGAFHMEFSHYDEVPAFARDKIIAEAAAGREG
jgi:elongation factor G